ncbi:response regulator [Seonamhaeicola sp. NFXS20]|uniref:hybrid sensor histidine kinase/response regulator transcription factor n=1 Tax=Seonamhaeicola sp. NFXS20 TaxID=2816959 RepID=UPI003B8BF0A1
MRDKNTRLVLGLGFKILLTLNVLALIIVTNVSAQNVNYKFKTFSTKQGLSQSTVMAIHQDRMGQMWFGTRDGLNRFDGSEFKVYRNIANDSLSISSNHILSITQDKEGYIWVGTYNGLNKFNPEKNTFARFFRNNSSNSIVGNRVWSIYEIDNEIWVGTTNGLSIFDKIKNEFINVNFLDKESISIKNNFITKILRTSDGSVLIGTSTGLYKLIKRNKNSFSFKKYYTDITEIFNNYIIQDIIEDTKNNIWVATRKNGVLLIKKDSNKLTKLNKGITSVDFRALTLDKEGNVWLGANNGVYIVYSNGDFQYLEDDSLNKVKSIFLDKKGSVWVGTYYDGLSLWDENNLSFRSINDKEGQHRLSYKVVSSIEKDFKDNIYVGTEGAGITIFNQSNERIGEINDGQLTNYVKSLLVLDNTYLLVGTFAKGISVFDINTRKYISDYFPKELTQIIEKSSIYCLKKEKANTLLIGAFGKGLIRYNTIDKSFQIFNAQEKENKSITSNGIRTVLYDSKKRIWVGTIKGLNLITFNNHLNSFEIEYFFFNPKINSGDDILTLFEDNIGNIWVGTKSQGLYKFNGVSFKKIRVVSEDNKTEIKSIHAILEDEEKGLLWISSNSGIARFNQNSNKTIIYNQTDGLIDNEFNDNAALKMPNNKFYFGGPSGISFFDSEKIYLNTFSPQVILTDFKIENKSVNIQDEGILKKHISFTKSITLSHDNANFSVNFSIPNFINPNNNLYSYRLIGVQDKWLTTPNREATYTIQKPGTYTFEVKGANNSKVWNDKPTILEINIKPAPWRTWWAFTIYSLLILATLFMLLRFIKSKAKLKHKLELEHIENVRKEELTKAKLDFFTNISHEFRTPLTLILGPLQQILANYDGSSKMYKKLLTVESSANHLFKLINRLMNFRKLEGDHFKLEAAEGNILKFLKEIYYSFTEHAKNGGYDYSFNTEYDKINVYYDRDKLESVFYNLISNAFKYTPKGGDIRVNVKKDDDNIYIEVEDNGVGIPEKYLDKIFDRFFEMPKKQKSQNNYKDGTGIGLAIAKHIVKLHKGQIEVKNKESRGVIFKVSLKLGRHHLTDEEILSNFKMSDDVSLYESQLKQSDFKLPDDTLDHLEIKEDKPIILIVEDHKPLRSFIKNLLKENYNIKEADNGEDAMKKALKIVPDLIISDVMMPVMSGTELCVKIKENLKTSHIPFVLLTSRSSLIYRLEGLELGADEYISKPFNVKEFKLKIKNILEFNNRLKNKFTSNDYTSLDEISFSSLDEKLLKKAFKIVEDNISNEQFNIPAFYSELGVSRTVLFEKIKAWANVTPNEFILQIRMKKATQLLEQDKFKISEICYKVGFKNPRYFSKSFQKRYGLTPSEYRDKFFETNV